MEIFPSLDLRGGRVVRLRQGDFDQQTVYPVDPIDAAVQFEQAGARWLHLVDLDAAKTGGRGNLDLVRKIAARTGLSIQVGGGVRSEADIRERFDSGATRVVVGTAAVQNWAWFQNLANSAEFSSWLVLALDARDGVVATHAWSASSGLNMIELAKETRGLPLASILYTDVSRDGMLKGPDLDGTSALVGATDVPVLASGGVASLDDILRLLPTGARGVVLGRSLHEGKFTLADAIRVARG